MPRAPEAVLFIAFVHSACRGISQRTHVCINYAWMSSRSRGIRRLLAARLCAFVGEGPREGWDVEVSVNSNTQDANKYGNRGALRKSKNLIRLAVPRKLSLFLFFFFFFAFPLQPLSAPDPPPLEAPPLGELHLLGEREDGRILNSFHKACV